jgi:hypothetical protein
VIVRGRRDLKYLAVLRVATDVRADGTVDDWTSRRSFASRPMNGAKTVSAPYAWKAVVLARSGQARRPWSTSESRYQHESDGVL